MKTSNPNSKNSKKRKKVSQVMENESSPLMDVDPQAKDVAQLLLSMNPDLSQSIDQPTEIDVPKKSKKKTKRRKKAIENIPDAENLENVLQNQDSKSLNLPHMAMSSSSAAMLQENLLSSQALEQKSKSTSTLPIVPKLQPVPANIVIQPPSTQETVASNNQRLSDPLSSSSSSSSSLSTANDSHPIILNFREQVKRLNEIKIKKIKKIKSLKDLKDSLDNAIKECSQELQGQKGQEILHNILSQEIILNLKLKKFLTKFIKFFQDSPEVKLIDFALTFTKMIAKTIIKPECTAVIAYLKKEHHFKEIGFYLVGMKLEDSALVVLLWKFYFFIDQELKRIFRNENKQSDRRLEFNPKLIKTLIEQFEAAIFSLSTKKVKEYYETHNDQIFSSLSLRSLGVIRNSMLTNLDTVTRYIHEGQRTQLHSNDSVEIKSRLEDQDNLSQSSSSLSFNLQAATGLDNTQNISMTTHVPTFANALRLFNQLNNSRTSKRGIEQPPASLEEQNAKVVPVENKIENRGQSRTSSSTNPSHSLQSLFGGSINTQPSISKSNASSTTSTQKLTSRR